MNAFAACARPAHVLVHSRRAEPAAPARRAVADGLLGVVTDTEACDDTLLVLSELMGDAVTGRGMAVVEALGEAWGTSLLGSGRRAVWARIPLTT